MAWKFFTAAGQEKQISSGGVAVPGYVQLYRNVLGVNTAVLDTGAGGLSQAYNHLEIILSIRHNGANVGNHPLMRFNADATAANYYANGQWQQGATHNGGDYLGTQPGFFWDSSCAGATAPSGVFSGIRVRVYDYASATKKKVVTSEAFTQFAASAGNQYQVQQGGIWLSTAPVTRIQVVQLTGTELYVPDSSITVYGVN